MKNKHLPLYILSGLIIVGYFTFLFILQYHAVPESNKDIINQAAGALLMAFAAVVSYWVGSSAGSKEKSDLLAKAPSIVEKKE